MMNYAIEVIDVSKRFKIYHDKTPTLKERLVFWGRQSCQEFWALKDVNVKIPSGGTVGLIGRNGSGKSTLLKLLSKIIYPDTGNIQINGKVSTLLELGAGFHADFTGRENIYLNASILGISKKEVDKRIDEIIAFSELEDFIDSPVRNYSTGMYMRLGFSVAVHVDPDILLVDEVMAVGDTAFQKKCMEKINEFRQLGKTIVFVTHDMGLVRRICDHVVWLENGQVLASGPATEVINNYMDLVVAREETRLNKEKQRKEHKEITKTEAKEEEQINGVKTQQKNNVTAVKPERWGNRKVEINKVWLTDSENHECYSFECGDRMNINISYLMNEKVDDLVFGIGIFRNDGLQCYGTNMDIDRCIYTDYPLKGVVECKIETLGLLEGRYYLDVAAHTRDGLPYDYQTKYLEFSVISRIHDVGVARLFHQWDVKDATEER